MTERLAIEDFIRVPRIPPARYHVDQICQRDGGTWMTLQPGTLFTVNKIKMCDVSSKKTGHISRNPRPTRVPWRIMSAPDCTNMN
jgi:hypothetical protein